MRYQRTVSPLIARVSVFVVAGFIIAADLPAAHIGEVVHNPDWSIRVTDFGYSDGLLDKRPGFEGREYLSGEWASAILYDQMQNLHGIPEAMWFENSNFAPGMGKGTGTFDFEAPDWPTNSTFTSVVDVTRTADGNGPGLDTATSTISNGGVRIKQDFTMIDTTTGIDQGFEPAVTGATPESIISNRYILKQDFEITNISGQTLTGIQLFQFLHGLFSTESVYDDRMYPGLPFDDYHYDVTLRGTDKKQTPGFDHDDVVSFHSDDAPSAWEVGPYDRLGPVDGTGKPLMEIHIDVEKNILDSTRDHFLPPGVLPEGIGSGAQRFSLGSLAPDQTVEFDVLLTVFSETTETPAPEPSTLMLLMSGFLLLGLTRRHKSRR